MELFCYCGGELEFHDEGFSIFCTKCETIWERVWEDDFFCERCKKHIENHERVIHNGIPSLELGENVYQEIPRCGFYPNGKFKKNNWSCETLIALRQITDHHSWNDDESIDVIHILKGEYLVLTYYKGRGKTGNAMIMCDDEYRELTLKEAEEILEYKEETR